MIRVAGLLESPANTPVPVPRTEPSAYRSTGRGNDLHVAYRGLTEQLVCEVNALLADEDDHMTLVDEIVGNEILFSVHYRGRAAVVSTAFGDGTAFGRVVADGLDCSEPRELAGADAIEDLLVLLLVEAGTPPHRSV